MKRQLVFFLILCLCLTGCSKKGADSDVTVKWDNNSWTIDGNSFAVDDYYGYGASAYVEATDESYTFELIFATDLSFAEGNIKGVEVDNMDTYKNKAKGFSLYLNTYYVMYYPIGGDYWVMGTCGSSIISRDQMQLNLWNICSKIKLTNGSVKVDIGGVMMFESAMSIIHIKNDGVSIPNMIKVSKGYKAECVTPHTVIQGENSYVMNTYSTDKYSYYQYGEYLVQTLIGLDISEYITFK